jgi:hypothetical protein
MANRKVLYTSAEIFAILQEQHRLCAPLDCMADPAFNLQRSSMIWEWRAAQDLIEWYDLSQYLNQEFRIDIELNVWKKVLTPEDERTLGGLCDFISTVAEKEIVVPVKRLGKECLSAAVFLTLKKNLKSKGVDVSQLMPSTDLAPFLYENFSPLIEEITLTGVKTFESLSYGELQSTSRLKYWIDKILPHIIYKKPINTGKLKTFRDLVERIMENQTLVQETI